MGLLILFLEWVITTQGEDGCRNEKKGKCGDLHGLVGIESAHRRESNVETVRVNGGDDMLNIKEGKIKTLNMRKCK